MTTELGKALRSKFASPAEALKKLGLDEGLLKKDMENIMATGKPTKFASTALQLVAHAVGPCLAKDQKVDLLPVFKDLTAKTFDKAKVRLALDGALKGKLAKDAEPNMGHVATMLDHIEHMSKPEVADESVSEPQHNAMAAAAGGNSTLDIPKKVGEEFMRADKGKTGFDAEPFKAFLKEKGMGEDDIMKACDMLPKPALDETPEEKAKREAEEMKAATDKKAADEAVMKAEEDKKKAEDAMKGMITKDEMNKAITAAVTANDERHSALRKALTDVKPVVGELAMSFDSAEAVYRHVAKMKGVPDSETLPAAALPTIISMLPKTSAPKQVTMIAADEATSTDFAKMFPGSERIGLGPVG